MENDKEYPRVLIEKWFPFEEVGIEGQRERGMASAMPSVNFMHVWWARRPLSASKGAILASLLPETKDKDFKSYMNFCKGLKESYEKIQLVKRLGTKERIGYSGERSFKINLNLKQRKELHDILSKFWKSQDIKILDCFSGGGSIPFEGSRLDLDVYSSELNPVALIVQFCTIKYPINFGNEFFEKNRKYFDLVLKNSKSKLKEFFPKLDGQINDAYIWVRTVNCPNPNCNLIIPLSPVWDLQKKPNRIIIQLQFSKVDYTKKSVKFKITKNPSKEILINNTPTIKRGIGKCPRCGEPLTNDYLKNESLDGRIGHKLAVIVYYELIGKKKFKKFRTSNEADIKAIEVVTKMVNENLNSWIDQNFLPDEDVDPGYNHGELLRKGIDKWYKLFNPRQLYTNITFFREILNLKKKLLNNSKLKKEEIIAIITYLHMIFDKIIDRNSIQTRYVSSTQRIANTFDRHDFAFKWSYAEMEVLERGFDWAYNNVEKAYNGLVRLLENTNKIPQFYLASANNLHFLSDKSIHAVIIDPPYYNNVFYAELSDFFYVWMKRSLGDLYPGFFNSELTDKDNEAVANPTRFEGMGRSKKALAKDYYEARMLASFHEIKRVLKDDGILTIMFTHKATDAWDTLAMSLMEAGFEISASWPVHTESNISLQIARKNAVKTTIFLVCRMRSTGQEELWWEDDILPSIKKIVAKKAKEFRKLGIDGIDLFISCFGPALKEFSKSYPVKNIAGDIVRAEEAIEAARRVVIEFTLQDIIKGKSYNIDPVSKFYLIAWHFFKARTFPFDEARRLALSIGINIDELKTGYKILNKKSGDVYLILPKEREKSGTISVDNPNDKGILVNATHIAILAYEQGGKKLYENVIEKLRRNTDRNFRLYMETLFNFLPDVKDLDKNLPEKKLLGEILMTTVKHVPKGDKITDFLDK